MRMFLALLFASWLMTVPINAETITVTPGTSVGGAPNTNDVGFDIIGIAGQSNAVGNGIGVDAALDFSDPRIRQWSASGADVNNATLAIDPLNFPAGQQSNAIGFAMTFGREYVKTLPPNRGVLFVPVAVDGTGFLANNWNPGNAAYNTFIANANAAVASHVNNRYVGTLWHQGENDTTVFSAGMSQSQYATALDAVISGSRGSITGAGGSWFILGQMVPSWIAANLVGVNPVNLAHINTPGRTGNTQVAFWYGSMSPPITCSSGQLCHYSNIGERVNGQAAFNAWFYALANTLGNLPRQVLNLTTTITSSTSITASFDFPLSRVTDFKVNYRTPSGSGAFTTVDTSSLQTSFTVTGLTNGATYDVQVFALNEAGNGPVSATSTIALTPPNAPTSLVAGTPLAGSVPLSWTAPASGNVPTSYTVQYRTPPGSGGFTTFSPSPITTNTNVSGLSPSTQYEFQVASTNGAGTSAFAPSVNATTTAVAFLVDTVAATSSHAYSTRKLASAYAGSAATITNSGGGSVTLGFTAAADPNTTSLLASLGSNSGTIATLFDQEGANNLTQATGANQPRVVNSGVPDTVNGQLSPTWPAINSTQGLTNAAGFPASGDWTVTTVAQLNATPTSLFPVILGGTTHASRALFSNSGPASAIFNGTIAPTSASNMNAGSTYCVTLTFVAASKTLTLYVSNVQVGQTTTAANAVTDVSLSMGTIDNSTTGWGGYIPEIVIWPSVLNSTQLTAAYNNDKSYWGCQ